MGGEGWEAFAKGGGGRGGEAFARGREGGVGRPLRGAGLEGRAERGCNICLTSAEENKRAPLLHTASVTTSR